MNLDVNGLGTVRSLGRQGIEVHGIDWKETDVGYHSRYCRKVHVLPHPAQAPDRLVEELLRLGASYPEKPVLVPTADYYVEVISRNRDALGKVFRFNIPATELLENIVDKNHQYALAESAGVPIARTFVPANLEELSRLKDQFRYPIFVKGQHSHLWSAQFTSKGFVAKDYEELQKHVQLALSKNVCPLLQEIILGPNRNHFKVCAYYAADRRLLALFGTKKLRQFPVDFGTGTCMVSSRNDALAATAIRFFEKIQYTGVGSIEFKLDDRDGKYKLIELNPRLWLQNVQSSFAGVNFAEVYYLDLIGENPKPQIEFRENIVWVDFQKDVESFLGNRSAGYSFFIWLKSILGAKSFAYWAWDDMRPFAQHTQYGAELLSAPRKILRSLFST